jgi:glycerol-3-phosphate cytidylyltransferase
MKLLKDFSKKELADLQKGQKIMTNMLKEFDNICRTNGLKYWCVGGTLIGTVRHKGWIPHDADIDVGMLESDYKKLQKIIQKKLSKDYWFQDKSTDKYYRSNVGKIRYLYAQYDDYKCQDWHNGLQLDIFVNTLKNDILTPNQCNNDSQPYKYNLIFPLKEIFFEDIKVYVPNQLSKYCIDAWGGYPPPQLSISKQYPHEGRISFTVPIWMKEKYPFLYKNNTVITFGTFDIFHIGHLKIINRASKLKGQKGKMIVGVSSDKLNFSKKKRRPIFNQNDRLEIISNIKGVDEVFIEESLELKREYILKYKANILVMCDDWLGKFDEFKDICEIVYLPRTNGISTTSTIDDIKKRIM